VKNLQLSNDTAFRAVTEPAEIGTHRMWILYIVSVGFGYVTQSQFSQVDCVEACVYTLFFKSQLLSLL